MKKMPALLVALIMVISLTTGCGAGVGYILATQIPAQGAGYLSRKKTERETIEMRKRMDNLSKKNQEDNELTRAWEKEQKQKKGIADPVSNIAPVKRNVDRLDML
jgi:hypothetical protein